MADFVDITNKSEIEGLTHIFTYYNIFIQAWYDSSHSCNYASYDEAVRGAVNCDPYWQYHNIYRIDLYKDENGVVRRNKEFICRLPSKKGHKKAEYHVLGVKTEEGLSVLKTSESLFMDIDNIDELKEKYPNLGIYKVVVGYDDNEIKYEYILERPIKDVTLDEKPRSNGRRKK